MAVKTNITINIVEPGSDVPVPDTGLFTHGIGNAETTIIVSAALVTILVILSIVLTTYMYRKHKKQGRTTKLVHIIDQTKAVVKSKKRITIGLSIIALLVSACTFTAFMLNTNNSNTSAIEGNDTEQQTGNTEQSENTNNLTINAESKELTIEVKDQPVFAVLPVQVTVEEATTAGYTLTAYTDSTDLVSTTNPNNKIPMVTVEGDELTSLEDNTWGLALDNEPEAKDNKVYTALSTDQDNPTIIKTIDDYSETPVNDTTTIYYGFYITPDIPYGTYAGASVSHDIEENRTDLAKVTFDGNGLYFNGNPGQTTNVVKYVPNTVTSRYTAYSHTDNIDDDGKMNDVYKHNLDVTNVYRFSNNAAKVRIKAIRSSCDYWCGPPDGGDYFSFWPGSHPEYTASNDYDTAVHAFGNTDGKNVFKNYNIEINEEIELQDQNAVTIAYTTNDRDNYDWCSNDMSGYGFYVVITAQDADGNDVSLIGNEFYHGKYLTPASDKPHKFLGWSTDKNATTPTYYSEQDIITKLSLETNNSVTLYAIWQRGIEITYDGNGADADIDMDNMEQHGYAVDLATANLQVDLLAPNFMKQGYGFVGWSADKDAWSKITDDDDRNDPVVYGPNQTITIDESIIAEAGENRKLILNAVWAPAEKDNSGKPISLQNWQGCNNLTATTYDSETRKLAVGKNTVTALTDNRDGNVYTVARLADGNCWMTENLRLDNSATNESATSEFTAENTNNPSLPLVNDYVSNARSNRLSISSDDWCDVSSPSCSDQSKFDNSNIKNANIAGMYSQDFTRKGYSHKSLNYNIYSYGDYYNLYSATVGNGRYYDTEGRIISGDICPAGWHIPIHLGEISGSFANLDLSIGGTGDEQNTLTASNRWRSFPNNFVYSGTHRNSYPARGDTGAYWTSTAAAGNYAYTFNVSQTHLLLYEGVNVVKFDGASVRCVTLVE